MNDISATSSPASTLSPPAGGPRVLVKDIADKSKIKGIYLVARKVNATDRNGKAYLSLILMDKSGQIDARVFENADKLGASFDEQEHVRINGTAKSFQGRLQLHVQHIEKVQKDEVVAEDYLPASQKDAEQMWRELREILDTVRDPDIARLLRALFDDPDTASRFRQVPAAKTIHHAWVGGLMEHNLSVLKIVDGLCRHYARESPGLLNRDLCIAGAVLHDFGKIYELSGERSFEYTHEGRLIGHLVQCSQRLAEVAATLPDFPRSKLIELQHIVLSHHDRLEFGSPKRPKTAEAMLVHAADQLDSRMGFLRQLFERESAPGWSSYQKVFDRYFYHRPPQGAGSRDDLPGGDMEGTQRSEVPLTDEYADLL